MTRDDVVQAVTFCREYNLTYLPPLLIFMCRMKGKQAKERNTETELQEVSSEFCSDSTVMGKVHEFELFFERFLLVFLRNLHLLNVSDLTRLTWAYQNVWSLTLRAFLAERAESVWSLQEHP